MRKTVKRVGLVAALVLVAGVAGAKPVIYDCKPEAGRSDSVIQPEYVISYDRASGEVLVNDPIIMGTVGKPIAGQVAVGKRCAHGVRLAVEIAEGPGQHDLVAIIVRGCSRMVGCRCR